jgi:uncharacterized membrane protein YhaH (DUF805 family)
MIVVYSLTLLGLFLESPLIEGLGTIASLALFLPGIAVGVRRMHDVGKSGWFLLIPIYNIILCFTDGDAFTNEYGPDPKGRGDAEEFDFEKQ